MMPKQYRVMLNAFFKIYVPWFDRSYTNEIKLQENTEAFNITWRYFPGELKYIISQKRLIHLFNLRLQDFRNQKG